MSALRDTAFRSEVSTQILDVTPTMAKEWLDDGHKNRKVKKNQVLTFAKAMKAGEWRLNGQPIVFSDAGRLLDGQHRMLAVVSSGETVRFLVARGVKESAMVTLDRGTKRSFADVLGIEGFGASRAVAGAVRFAMSLQDGSFEDKARTYSYETMAAWLAINGRIVDSVANYRVASRGLMPIAQVAGLHYLMSKKDPKLASDFWTRVIVGEGISKNDVEYKLRDRLLMTPKRAGMSFHMQNKEKAALAIKAWNALRSGTKVERLMWKQDGAGIRKEGFPVIS